MYILHQSAHMGALTLTCTVPRYIQHLNHGMCASLCAKSCLMCFLFFQDRKTQCFDVIKQEKLVFTDETDLILYVHYITRVCKKTLKKTIFTIHLNVYLKLAKPKQSYYYGCQNSWKLYKVTLGF